MQFTRNFIEKKLAEKATSSSPEAMLVMSIIAQAFVDSDIDYLKSLDCKKYAELIGIELSFIKEFGAVCITHNIMQNPTVLSSWICRSLSCSKKTTEELGVTLTA